MRQRTTDQGARCALAPLRKLLRADLPGLAAFLLLASCAGSVKHDEMLAAKRAVEFAQFVFVNKTIEKGYELLSDSGKRRLSLDKFKETVTRMHPRTFPTKVTATEFQPMPGEQAIWIYLAGQNAEEQFQYRLTMEGTGNGDYKILTFDTGVVGRMFSPLSDRQPFKTTISTH
jgi:hypothetical protein